MTLISIKSAPFLSTSGDNFWQLTGRKREENWSEWFHMKVYIVVCYFSLIIFSTVELTSFATRTMLAIISLEQMYHLTSTNVLSPLNKCIISLQQMYYLPWTNVSSHFNKCIISCEQMYYLPWTNVSSHFNKCTISLQQMYYLPWTNVSSHFNKCIVSLNKCMISLEKMYCLLWTNVLSALNKCIISLQQMYYLPWTNVLSPWTNVLSPLHKIYYLLEQMYYLSSQKKQAFSRSHESCVNYLSRLETCFNFLLICSEVTSCFNPYPAVHYNPYLCK